MNDISSIEDIKLLVNNFYEKIREDKLLAPIFNNIIKENWPVHLEKMYSFWQTILLDQHTYTGSPFLPHSKLPLTKDHFETWLTLWHQTVDNLFLGEKAQEAKARADKMAIMFLSKIEYYKNNQAIPLL